MSEIQSEIPGPLQAGSVGKTLPAGKLEFPINYTSLRQRLAAQRSIPNIIDELIAHGVIILDYNSPALSLLKTSLKRKKPLSIEEYGVFLNTPAVRYTNSPETTFFIKKLKKLFDTNEQETDVFKNFVAPLLEKLTSAVKPLEESKESKEAKEIPAYSFNFKISEDTTLQELIEELINTGCLGDSAKAREIKKSLDVINTNLVNHSIISAQSTRAHKEAFHYLQQCELNYFDQLKVYFSTLSDYTDEYVKEFSQWINQQSHLYNYPERKESKESKKSKIELATDLPKDMKFMRIAKIGDLHGNALLALNFAQAYGAIDIPPEFYERLVDICRLPPELIGVVELNEFRDILKNNMKIADPDVMLRFLGDTLCDRGPSDILTLEIFKAFGEKNIKFDILMSNHDNNFLHIYGRAKAAKEAALMPDSKKDPDTEFINELMQTYFADQGNIHKSLTLDNEQLRSFNHLIDLLVTRAISVNELEGLVETYYKPHLRALACSIKVNPENPGDGKSQTLTVDTHALANLESIKSIAKYYGIDHGEETGGLIEKTPFEIAEIIELINSMVSLDLARGSKMTNELFANFRAASAPYSDVRPFPLLRLCEEREHRESQRGTFYAESVFNTGGWPPARQNLANRAAVKFTHGHDGPDRYLLPNVSSLDGNFGKRSPGRSCLIGSLDGVCAVSQELVCPPQKPQIRHDVSIEELEKQRTSLEATVSDEKTSSTVSPFAEIENLRNSLIPQIAAVATVPQAMRAVNTLLPLPGFVVPDWATSESFGEKQNDDVIEDPKEKIKVFYGKHREQALYTLCPGNSPWWKGVGGAAMFGLAATAAGLLTYTTLTGNPLELFKGVTVPELPINQEHPTDLDYVIVALVALAVIATALLGLYLMYKSSQQFHDRLPPAAQAVVKGEYDKIFDPSITENLISIHRPTANNQPPKSTNSPEFPSR